MDFTKSQYWDFPKGKPMIFVKSCKNSPLFVFAQNELWNNVRWSSSKKTSPSKVQKYWIYRVTKPFFFPKGLNQDFGQKLEFSSLLVFEQNGLWNDVSWSLN